MKDVIVILGPTASGKTALSIALAQEGAFEIVSADSMQIYRGMDIGSAKPDIAERAGIPHHLLDIAGPEESFSVAAYQELAFRTIDEIHQRGRIPLMVGGTGLYLEAVIDNRLFSEVPSDEELRTALEQEAELRGVTALHERLAAIDPDSADRIHANDLRRTIRALEVFQLTGKTMTQMNASSRRPPRYNFMVFGISQDRNVLYDRINRRVSLMLELGLVEEVRRLKAQGIGLDTTAMQGIGYKEIIQYLNGNFTLEEAAEIVRMESRRYAKRQMTWFRRMKNVIWLDAASLSLDAMIQDIKKRVAENGIIL